MKKFTFSFSLAVALSLLATACKTEKLIEEPALEITSDNVIEQLLAISEDSNHTRRKENTSILWNYLQDSLSIPYVKNDTALLLYYGEAQKVEWNGDFNSWSRDKSFSNDGKRIDSTDLWYLIKTFPSDSRLDYKITLNGSNWILDPNNPQQQWSGFGPNSVLAMPDWKEEDVTKEDPNALKGSISEKKTIQSNHLNYAVNYWVYQPNASFIQEQLPVMYVTDGHEYSDEKLGNMYTVLDNLISQNKIEPILVVFIDPRNPSNTQENRRQEEYVVNEAYLSFVKNELQSTIKEVYGTIDQQTAILGTSLGGLNASYFGAAAGDTFEYVAAQSPAYWYNTSIFDLVQNASTLPKKVFVSAGTFNDGLENAQTMENIYKQQGVNLQMLVVNEGHSWGALNQQLDNILLHFYGK